MITTFESVAATYAADDDAAADADVTDAECDDGTACDADDEAADAVVDDATAAPTAATSFEVEDTLSFPSILSMAAIAISILRLRSKRA